MSQLRVKCDTSRIVCSKDFKVQVETKIYPGYVFEVFDKLKTLYISRPPTM